MAKFLINTTGSPISIKDTGITIAASATYNIVPEDFPLWASSVNIDTYINAGTIVVNDGIDNLTADFALRHIHNESMDRNSAYHAAGVSQETQNSTLSLTVDSRILTIFTGTTAGQIVKLPNATLLNVGSRYEVWNTSTESVVVKNFSDTSLFVISAQQKTSITLAVNTPSSGTWLFEANFLGGTGGGNGCLNFGYNGTANNGRWYEVISNNPSNNTPFIIAGSKAIRSLSVVVDTNSTSTVSIFKNGVVIETISLTNEKKNTKLNLNHILLDKDEISIQLTSGTQSRPNVTIWL